MSNPGSLSTGRADRAAPLAPDRNPASLSDQAFWRQYLRPDEHILWTDRPTDEFRMGGMSKTYGVTFGLAVLLILPVLSTYRPPELVVFLFILMAFGVGLAFGPGKLDQKNRRNRRYALTQMRALATRDFRHGQPRMLEIGEGTRALTMEDRDSGEFIVAVLNRGANDETGHAVQFERLTEDQVADALDALSGQGVTG